MHAKLMSNLTKDVVHEIRGFKLDSYLIALEGWRRGLKLTWHKDQSNKFKFTSLGGSTLGKHFTLSSSTTSHDFFRSAGDGVSKETVKIGMNKEKTKELWLKEKVPTPQGKSFNIEDERMLDYAKKIGFPVIIKPANGSMGRGVYTNINSVNELNNALADFKKRYKYKKIILETHHEGQEYRIYVVGDKVVGATNRMPANVQGDGEHTIRELIKLKNKKRKNNPYLYPKPIKIDYEIELTLKKNDITLDTVLPEGETLLLRKVSNLSTGGDPIEATDDLSDEVKKVAVNALKALPELPHAGVDIIVDSKDKRKGVVLEVNSIAEIAFHVFPWEGKAKDVPGAIIDYYFPETKEVIKSNAFFDYQSVLGPLKTWVADIVDLTPAPVDTMYCKRYIVKGKVKEVGYMNFIRRQALINESHGYCRLHNKNEVEIVLISKEKNILDNFLKVLYKGSKKSKVEFVNEKEIDMSYKPFKLGFEILHD